MLLDLHGVPGSQNGEIHSGVPRTRSHPGIDRSAVSAVMSLWFAADSALTAYCSNTAGLHEGFWWPECGFLPDGRQYGESRATGSNMKGKAPSHFYIVLYIFGVHCFYMLVLWYLLISDICDTCGDLDLGVCSILFLWFCWSVDSVDRAEDGFEGDSSHGKVQ